MIYNNVGGASSGGYRPATFVIGTTTSGHTEKDCDYLCDGDADDVEIQAAIDALPSNGGKVLILDGEYKLTKRININNPLITVSGNGSSTILMPQNNSKGLRVFYISANTVSITDLYIDCSNISPSGSHTAYETPSATGVYIESGNYCYLYNITFSMPYYDATIIDNYKNADSAGVKTGGTIRYLKIINCRFNYGNYAIFHNIIESSSIEGCIFTSAVNVSSFNYDCVSIVFKYATDCFINNCIFNGSDDKHISRFIEQKNGSFSDGSMFITNNYFYGSSTRGVIFIEDIDNLIITENRFNTWFPSSKQSSDDYCALIALANDRSISNVIISQNIFAIPYNKSGYLSYGIYVVSGNVEYGVITDNTFDGGGYAIHGEFKDSVINSNSVVSNDGITLTAGSTRTVVTGNALPYDEVVDNGTHNVIANNSGS